MNWATWAIWKSWLKSLKCQAFCLLFRDNKRRKHPGCQVALENGDAELVSDGFA
ncbi:hypothetical protein BH11PLA2_BH11PLA2_16790 [soil metagenome]